MTTNLTKPDAALRYERDLITRAGRITAELERREQHAALMAQEHDMDPLDKQFARLAPGS